MIFDDDYTIPKMVRNSATEFAEITGQMKRVKNGQFEPVLYRELYQYGLDFGAALLSLGIQRGEPIGLISDNRAEWLYVDLGIMNIGAVDVPRGCDATPNDLEKILSITEAKYCIVENNSQVKKIIDLKDKLSALKTIISIESEVKQENLDEAKAAGVEVLFYEELMKTGQKWRIENKGKVEEELEKGKGDDLATIIFTSGTTGTPKGVMLTHHNFLAQLDEIPERIFLNPGDKALSVLPVWHVFEREVEYVILIQGATLCYSKPVGSILLADFKTLNPHLLPAVPRVFEAVYDGVTKKMRKTGGIVLGMFNFFVRVAKILKAMSRLMFNKNACYTRYYPVFWWIVCLIPWCLVGAAVGRLFRCGSSRCLRCCCGGGSSGRGSSSCRRVSGSFGNSLRCGGIGFRLDTC